MYLQRETGKSKTIALQFVKSIEEKYGECSENILKDLSKLEFHYIKRVLKKRCNQCNKERILKRFEKDLICRKMYDKCNTCREKNEIINYHEEIQNIFINEI